MSTPGEVSPPRQSPLLFAEPVLESPCGGGRLVTSATMAALLQSFVARMKLGHSWVASGTACTACEQHN